MDMLQSNYTAFLFIILKWPFMYNLFFLVSLKVSAVKIVTQYDHPQTKLLTDSLIP